MYVATVHGELKWIAHAPGILSVDSATLTGLARRFNRRTLYFTELSLAPNYLFPNHFRNHIIELQINEAGGFRTAQIPLSFQKNQLPRDTDAPHLPRIFARNELACFNIQKKKKKGTKKNTATLLLQISTISSLLIRRNRSLAPAINAKNSHGGCRLAITLRDLTARF